MIRPKNCDDCISTIEKSLDFSRMQLEPNTAHFKVWSGLAVLHDSNWGELLIRPLYDANMIVQIGFNTLVPVFSDLLLTPRKVNEHFTDSEKNKHVPEFETLLSSLQSSCDVHKRRCEDEKISETMVNMRTILDMFHEHPAVREALSIVYTIHVPARIVFKIMMERLSESLEKDTKIKKSSDIPFEFFRL